MIDEFRFQNLTTHHLSTQTLRGSGTDLKVGDILYPCFARDADTSPKLVSLTEFKTQLMRFYRPINEDGSI